MFDKYAASLTPHSIFGDKRLNTLFPRMVSRLGSNLGKTISQAAICNAEMQSYYGFLNSHQVKPEYIIMSEQDRLRAYLKEAPGQIILGPQDTTDIDLTGNRSSGAVGSLNFDKRKGFYAHTLLLLDSQGVGLGVLDQHHWSRDADYFGKDKSLSRIEEKESYRWIESFKRFETFFSDFPQHKAICICDREGDFFELFDSRSADNVHLLIRASKNRTIIEDGEKEKLWEKLDNTSPCFSYKAQIYNPKGKKETITLEVRYTPIDIPPNYRSKRDNNDAKQIRLWAVQTRQTSPMLSWQKHPICWRLLTTLPIDSAKDAIQVIDFYVSRWRIEEFHYILKQGCKIEELQLKLPDAIQNAIAFYSLIACKVLNIRYAILAQSNQPIEKFGFTQLHYHLICTFLFQKGTIKSMPTQPCTDSREFVKYLGLMQSVANPNKPPGVKTIWKSIQQLEFLITAWMAFTSRQ